jgi:hypothetical protein
MSLKMFWSFPLSRRKSVKLKINAKEFGNNLDFSSVGYIVFRRIQDEAHIVDENI